MTIQRTISPVDGSVVVERELADGTAVARALERAEAAFPGWRATPVAERCALLEKAVNAFVGRRDEIAREITAQMGRPIAQSPGEVRGFEERARYMLAAAPQRLAMSSRSRSPASPALSVASLLASSWSWLPGTTLT
jgi:acyl-CoA reductase-like NAD-dependent aldehyde dehydrogenase